MTTANILDILQIYPSELLKAFQLIIEKAAGDYALEQREKYRLVLLLDNAFYSTGGWAENRRRAFDAIEEMKRRADSGFRTDNGHDDSGFYRYSPNLTRYNPICVVTEKPSISFIHHYNIRLTGRWTPLPTQEYEERPGVECDFPALLDYTILPVISQPAWDVLGPLLGENAEALPIEYPDGTPHYILNVLDIVDCVDEERSAVTRYGDGTIMMVDRYVFKEASKDALQSKLLFKTPEHSGSDLITTRRFREAVEQNGLTGLDFVPL